MTTRTPPRPADRRRRPPVRETPARQASNRHASNRQASNRQGAAAHAPRGPATVARRVSGATPPRRRLTALVVVMALAFAAVVVRLVQVQAVDAPRYAAFGVSQRTSTKPL